MHKNDAKLSQCNVEQKIDNRPYNTSHGWQVLVQEVLVHFVNLRHIFLVQRQIDGAKILPDPLRLVGFGENTDAVFHLPAKYHLAYCSAVFQRDFGQNGFLEQNLGFMTGQRTKTLKF